MRPIPQYFACALACVGLAIAAASAAADAPLPTFQHMEAQGVMVGTIRIDARNIFDLTDPAESAWPYQVVNLLHIRTRQAVIARALLFKPGETVSVRMIDETERLLRANRFLYDVHIRPAAYHDGVVDIDVITRDTWTLDLAGTYSHSGGSNSSKYGALDYNLLGTGTTLGAFNTSNPDRHGTQFIFFYPQAFDGWTQLSYVQSNYDDGTARTASIVRPFYAVNTRWAAGTSWDREDRIDSIYNASEIVNQFRHRIETAEVFGGWSPGVVDGWTQRYSLGAAKQDDGYVGVPDATSPEPFPTDHTMRGPFVRYELLEDRFVRMRNHDQIARTEFVEMGLDALVQLTRSTTSWGASQSAWLYSATLTDGFALPWDEHSLFVSLVAQRSLASTGSPLTHLGAALRYYAPQGPRTAFYAALSGDRIGTAAAPDQLQLGGDTGLRGYPLRYQEGERRALLTLEERYYADWYPFRIARVGGAAFIDYGRAWGGVNQNTVNGGWLSDAGVGLRIALDRSFTNILHVDLAVPFNRAPGVKSVQYLVKVQVTF